MKFTSGDIIHQTRTGRNVIVLSANYRDATDEEYTVYDFYLGNIRLFYWNRNTILEWVLYHENVTMRPPQALAR